MPLEDIASPIKDMPGKSLSFEFYLNTEKYEVFYFDKFFMKIFGVGEASAVAVVPVTRLKIGQPVLVMVGDVFTVARAEYDKYSDICFVVEPETGEWIPIGKENVLGEPIGYCPINITGGELIKFSRLALI